MYFSVCVISFISSAKRLCFTRCYENCSPDVGLSLDKDDADKFLKLPVFWDHEGPQTEKKFNFAVHCYCLLLETIILPDDVTVNKQ